MDNQPGYNQLSDGTVPSQDQVPAAPPQPPVIPNLTQPVSPNLPLTPPNPSEIALNSSLEGPDASPQA
jgi:hypothetical protein